MDAADGDQRLVSSERGAAGRGWSLRSLPPPSGPDPDARVLGPDLPRTVLLTSSPLHGVLVLVIALAWVIWLGLLFGLLRPSDTGGLSWPALLGAAGVGTVVCALAAWFCHRLTRPLSLTLSEHGYVARDGRRRVAGGVWGEVRRVEIRTGKSGAPGEEHHVAHLVIHRAGEGRPARLRYPLDLADGLAALLQQYAGTTFAGITEATGPLGAATGRRGTWDWLRVLDGWTFE